MSLYNKEFFFYLFSFKFSVRKYKKKTLYRPKLRKTCDDKLINPNLTLLLEKCFSVTLILGHSDEHQDLKPTMFKTSVQQNNKLDSGRTLEIVEIVKQLNSGMRKVGKISINNISKRFYKSYIDFRTTIVAIILPKDIYGRTDLLLHI
jgi:hypothetical protein